MNYRQQIKKWGKATARRKAKRRAKGRISEWVPYKAAVPETKAINETRELKKGFFNKFFKHKEA